jgi:hypothetical protein
VAYFEYPTDIHMDYLQMHKYWKVEWGSMIVNHKLKRIWLGFN